MQPTPEQFTKPHTLADEKTGNIARNRKTVGDGTEYVGNQIPVDTRGGK
jgi:hypothetical protein